MNIRFQGPLNKYTNAFKRYQTRYFVLDTQAKHLLYFMVEQIILFPNEDSIFCLQPDEIRKKGPRGVIELIDCWISPSNEDDITFSVQTGAGDTFKLRGKNQDFYRK